MREDDWLALIEADPADVQTRLAYADWLEEEGDAVAGSLQRWIVREGKAPFDWKSSTPFDHSYDTVDWYDGSPAAWDVPASCILPMSLWELLEPLRVDSTGSWAEFSSRAQAEAALLVAWYKLADAGLLADTGLPLDSSTPPDPEKRLRAELLSTLRRNGERFRRVLVELLAGEIPLEEGRRLQFEIAPDNYAISLSATGAAVLPADWLLLALPEGWFERANDDEIDENALVSEVLLPWVAERWQEVGGPGRYSPAYLIFRGSPDPRYDLERRQWISSQEAFGS